MSDNFICTFKVYLKKFFLAIMEGIVLLLVFFFFGRETQNLSREKSPIFAREMKLRPWKNLKNPSKLHVKISFCPWIFWQITHVKKKLIHVKKNRKYPRQIWQFCPWNPIFSPVKKTKKYAREKKIRAWKKLKIRKKTGVKSQFCPWKNPKKPKKRAFTPVNFFTPKKKNTASSYTSPIVGFKKKKSGANN